MPDTEVIYRYRSPYRPLDIGWLPPEVNQSYRIDPHTWTPAHVYEFALPIPDQFVKQWSLEMVG